MLAVDYERSEICWTDSRLARIECAGFSGQNRRVVYTPAAYPFGITVVNGNIYWTDWEIHFIQRVNRNGGDAEPLELPLGGNGKLYGITSVPSQCPRVTTLCASHNGGCQYLCLPNGNGQRTCACPEVDEDSDDVIDCNQVI
ncbi:nidogen-1-like isoform X2 [Limulus polyphemus]|uniref:Nidogen-1-like isoform X2 n=1 Tax=Limulus polyphemus TaxID=6850 RepID=A0ABM1RXR2_LIMPO|nr:nidogen-1-like isoform X2 [Limulus polyphemus]